MRIVNAFISKHFTDLVHPIEPTNNKLLKEKLGCDSQFKVSLQHFWLSNEGLCEGSAGLSIKYRSFNFEKVALIKELSEESNDLSTCLEELFQFTIDN